MMKDNLNLESTVVANNDNATCAVTTESCTNSEATVDAGDEKRSADDPTTSKGIHRQQQQTPLMETPPAGASSSSAAAAAAAASVASEQSQEQVPPAQPPAQAQAPAAAAARTKEEEFYNHEIAQQQEDEGQGPARGLLQGGGEDEKGQYRRHQQSQPATTAAAATPSPLPSPLPSPSQHAITVTSSSMMSMLQDLPMDMMPQSMPAPPPPEEPARPGAFAHSGPARFARPPAARPPAPPIIQQQQALQQMPPRPQRQTIPMAPTTCSADGDGDEELQEATLVDETFGDDEFMMNDGSGGEVAQPVDRKAERRKRRERRKARQQYQKFLKCMCYLITFAIVCSTIGMGIQIYQGVQETLAEEEEEAEKQRNQIDDAPPPPTTTATGGAEEHPSHIHITIPPRPTAPPTTAEDALVDFVSTLPNSTLQQLEDPFTIQTQAYFWLLEHPDIAILTEWRKTQLFALACVYYGLLGDNMPNWPEPASRSWLDYERHECLWFSSSIDGTSTITANADTLYHSCNEEGQFIRLDLAGLNFAAASASDQDNTTKVTTTTTTTLELPPEVALLKNLQHIWLWDCHIHQLLDDFIPAELYQMTTLESMLLNGNDFVGSIPSHLLFSPPSAAALKALDLSHNLLTGSLLTSPPSSSIMSSSSSLEWLSVSNNIGLVGTIPGELAAAMSSSLKHFDVTGTSLTGTIPSELCSIMERKQEEELVGECLPTGVEWLPSHHQFSHNNIDNSNNNAVNDTKVCHYLGFDCSEELCGCDCPCVAAVVP